MNLFIKDYNLKIISIIFIIIFSFGNNYYYSNIGAFPIDTFLHYDSAYRILKNELPIRDFWVVSGIVVDLIQSIFFWIFGVNWNSLVIHSSILNSIICIFTYYFFLNLGINKLRSLIYTLCFSTLAYTISGTPFVDHHAVFFLLISSYIMTYVIHKPQKKYIWFTIVLLFFLSFFSKQVPAAYVIFPQITIISLYIFKEKKYDIFFISLFSFIILSITLISSLIYFDINLNLFYDQYFGYPKSIGENRFNSINNNLEDLFNNYKFLFLSIILIFFLKIKTIIIKKQKIYSLDNIKLLIILSLCISLIYHQILTKNQIFIYFLIPILFAHIERELKTDNQKLKKIFSFLIISTLIIITLKYHYRYNENRKFHDLNKDLINKTIPADKIHLSLAGLKWVNPFFNGEPEEEINYLKKAKIKLEKEKNELMLISHYLFLDSITKNKMNYPNRTFTVDEASYPVRNDKYKKVYKNYLTNLIKKKNIKRIFFLKHENISHEIITKVFDERCLVLLKDDLFYIYEIVCIK